MVILYRGWCPFGKQCKFGNRQVCKFYTRKQVVDKIGNHLRYSPSHAKKLSKEQIEEALWEMVVEEEEVEEEEPMDDEWQQEGEADDAIVDLSGDAEGSDGVGASSEVKRLSTAVKQLNTTVKQLAGTVPKAKPPSHPPPHIVDVTPSGGSRAGVIQVPRPTVNAVLDAFSRAEQALRHSAMVSTSAAQAFTSEANVLQNTRMHIEEVLLNADTTSRG